MKFITQLEARLQPNTGNTLRPVLLVFTRSSVTPPKVNRFECNLEHSEYILAGWPWKISGAICVVARVGESGEGFFLSAKHARFYRSPVGQI